VDVAWLAMLLVAFIVVFAIQKRLPGTRHRGGFLDGPVSRRGTQTYEHVAAVVANAASFLGFSQPKHFEGVGSSTWSGRLGGYPVDLVVRRGHAGQADVSVTIACDIGARVSVEHPDPLILSALVVERRVGPTQRRDGPSQESGPSGDETFDRVIRVVGDHVMIAAALDARLRKELLEHLQPGVRYESGRLRSGAVPSNRRDALLDYLDGLVKVAAFLVARTERARRLGGQADALAWNALKDPVRAVRQRCMGHLMRLFRDLDVAQSTLDSALVHRNRVVRLDALRYAERVTQVRVAAGLFADIASAAQDRLRAARILASLEPAHHVLQERRKWLIECLDASDESAILAAEVLGDTAELDAVHAMLDGPNATRRSAEVRSAVDAAVAQIRARCGGVEAGGLALAVEPKGGLALVAESEGGELSVTTTS